MSVTKVKSTATVIATQVRRSILAGALKHGQPLRQDEIAGEYGVSKIPVREALLILEGEGLVEFIPNRGAFVSELSAEDAREISIMRIALETAALREAIGLMTTSDFDHAETILTKIDACTDQQAWSDLNWQFHETLYRPANLPKLLKTIRELHVNVARHFRVFDTVDYLSQSQAEHRAILQACREQAVAHALDLLATHLRKSAEIVAAYPTATTSREA